MSVDSHEDMQKLSKNKNEVYKIVAFAPGIPSKFYGFYTLEILPTYPKLK